MRKSKTTAGWAALLAAAVSIVGLVPTSQAHAARPRLGSAAAPQVGSAEPMRLGVAASLGTVTVSPTSGTVTQNPMFATATTSAACPTGYGTNATLGVRAVGGLTLSPLRSIASDATYDQAAFSLAPARSMTAALFGPAGGTVAAGNYELAILCTGELLGDNPSMFITPITVTGTNWTVSDAPPTSAPQLGGSVRIEASVAPGPTTTTGTAAPPSGGGLPITGTALAAVVLAGLVLFGGGTGLVVAARRRRQARP